MLFGVKLIEVPNFSEMSGTDVANLFYNARHIAGNLWCFEGDEDAFNFSIGIMSEGAIDSTSDSDYDENAFIDKCAEVFGWDFTDPIPLWKMLDN